MKNSEKGSSEVRYRLYSLNVVIRLLFNFHSLLINVDTFCINNRITIGKEIIHYIVDAFIKAASKGLVRILFAPPSHTPTTIFSLLSEAKVRKLHFVYIKKPLISPLYIVFSKKK